MQQSIPVITLQQYANVNYFTNSNFIINSKYLINYSFSGRWKKRNSSERLKLAKIS